MEQLIQSLRKNYRALSGSFFLALILWFAVTSDKEYVYNLRVPLSIRPLEKGLVLKNIPPDYAMLKVQGSGRSLFTLGFLKQKIRLELPGLKKKQTIQLKNYLNRIQLPADLNIRILDIIYPRRIRLEVDRLAERNIPIKVAASIQPEAGYTMIGFELSSDSVHVQGPKSTVFAKKFIRTDSLYKAHVKYPFSQKVSLHNPSPGILVLNPGKIKVRVVVEPIVERVIYDVPIDVLHLPKDLTAETDPPAISIRVRGNESLISALTPRDIRVVFDYAKNYKPGKVRYLMQISVPPKVDWLEVSPQDFQLKLMRKGNGK